MNTIGKYLSDMQIVIAKKYFGLCEYEHKDALEWCKACIQKRIDQDHLQDQVDWNYLIVKDEKIDEHGWYRMECRLPLKELF